jgi:hypothetical protein
VLVPNLFLTRQGGQPGVFTPEAGKARWRPVKTGIIGPDSTQVVESLKAGDVVLRPINETASLRDGAKVNTP